MLNIALVSHTSALGGAERMLYNLAIILKQSDKYNPIVFMPNGPSDALESICINSQINAVKLPDYLMYIFATEKDSYQNAKKTLDIYREVATIFANYDIELIINNTATSLIPILAGIELHIPVIGWIHGILDSYMLSTQFDPERRLFIDRMFIALSNKILCCSNWTTAHYQQYNLTTINTLHNWTPEPHEVKDLDINNKTFICLNTLDYCKGIFTLLEASKQLRQRYKDFKVLIYGDGTEQITNEINEFLKNNKLENNVKLMGRTTEVSTLYNNCLCLVQPSFIESFGMTIVEAMAHNRPVIAAKSGGPEEIVLNNKTGFLIEKNNPKELAEKMGFFLENPTIAKEFGENGRHFFEIEYSEQRASKEFMDIFDDVTRNYKGISKERQLYFDSLIRMLKAEAVNSYQHLVTPLRQLVSNTNSIKPIEQDVLSYSKEIKDSRKYNILCEVKNLSSLAIIFASDKFGCSGKVEMNLYANGHLLRKATVPLASIIYQQWTTFNFPTIYNCGGTLFTIELNFYYNANSPHMGVMEDARYKTFIYKVFNKMGFPLKGFNSLYFNCIE